MLVGKQVKVNAISWSCRDQENVRSWTNSKLMTVRLTIEKDNNGRPWMQVSGGPRGRESFEISKNLNMVTTGWTVSPGQWRGYDKMMITGPEIKKAFVQLEVDFT